MNKSQRKEDLKKKLWSEPGGYADKFVDALIEIIIDHEEKLEELKNVNVGAEDSKGKLRKSGKGKRLEDTGGDLGSVDSSSRTK